MKKKISDAEHLSNLKALYESDAAGQVLQAANPELPPEMAQWLARLCLFYGVPFNHLVADERMLPMESIRFFSIDQNWLDSMVDGAFSVGTYSSRDTAYKQTMRPVIQQSARRAVGQVRSQLRGATSTPAPEPVVLMTGLLLRSALVSGWPGLEVKAYDVVYSPPEASPPTSPLNLLRMDRLSPTVLLCIFAGQVRQVELNQPTEGLHFGVEVVEYGSPLQDHYVIAPRGVGGSKYQPGQEITNSPPEWVEAAWRQQNNADTRVLDIATLQQRLNSSLLQWGAIAEGTEIGPADFAIQMVKAPFQQLFNNLASPPASPALAESSQTRAASESEIDEQSIMSSLFGS